MLIHRRAVVREIAGSAGAAFSVLFCIVFTQVLVRLLGDAAGGDVDPGALFSVVALSTLTNLPLILTLSLFIAVLIALTRAYRDSEMVVWFASGASLAAWLRPVLRCAVPVAIAVALLGIFVSPWAERLIAETRQRFEQRDDVSKVTAGRFIESAAADRVFFVENLDVAGQRVQSVFASQRSGGRDVVLVATQGSVETHSDGSRFLVLDHGRRYEASPGAGATRVLAFERYAIRLESAVPGPLVRTGVRALPTSELLAFPTPRNRGELLGRISLPVAALLLAVLALPLAHVNPRVGRSANLVFATLLALVYLNAILILQSSVQRGQIGIGPAFALVHGTVALLATALLVRRLRAGRAPWWRRRAAARAAACAAASAAATAAASAAASGTHPSTDA
jgi:lipopolysaccharide export system permease protein